MENPLEAYAEKAIAFQEQFLSTASEGTHWYLGDQFKEAHLVEGGGLMIYVGQFRGTWSEGKMETLVYITAQSPNIPETKAVYRLPVDGLNPDKIKEEVSIEFAVFEKFGLNPTMSKELQTLVEAQLVKFQMMGGNFS